MNTDLTGLSLRFARSCRPPPRRLANAHKVRSLQARTVILRFQKRLDKPGPEPVSRLEIPRKTTQDPPQHMARKIAAGNLRTDQEPAQADNPLKMRPALVVRPGHPALACGKAQGRRRKPDSAQKSVL